MNRILALAVFLIPILIQCSSTNSEFVQSIQEWDRQRLADLKRADGWTTVVGLFWLKEGANFIGSDAKNDLQFPSNAPPELGYLNLVGDSVWLHYQYTSTARIGSQSITPQSKPILLHPNEDGPNAVEVESFTFFPIVRNRRIGIRLRDSSATARFELDNIPRYPIDESWQVPARVIPSESGQTIAIDNVIGMSINTPVAATLEFELQDQTLNLLALEGGEDSFFVIFADATTGAQTYGGGRYVYVDHPDDQGMTYIDFNKAYNPPCVFTDFATCPLPPQENRLPIPIAAGERNLAEH